MTMIDKAEAHDDDLIRRGDALAIVNAYWQSIGGTLLDAIAERIAAIPARGVGVVCTWPSCPHTAKGQCQPSTRILAAPAPTDAARLSDAGDEARSDAAPKLATPQPGEVLASSAPAPNDAADDLASVAARIMADQKPMDLDVTEAQWQGLYETDPAPAPDAREAALVAALQWCSGSDDFQEGGKAREGWLKLCAPLLHGEARTC